MHPRGEDLLGQLAPEAVGVQAQIGRVLHQVLVVQRLWAASTREWMIAVYTGWVATYLVLTIVGTSMRGPGMDIFAPWAVPATHQCLEPNPQ